jgi:hypothetical protein
MMVKVYKQLSIFLENRPGALARVAGILEDVQVNVLALAVHDTVDHAVVRLIAEPHVKALLLLEQQGLYLIEQEVVTMRLDNHPGTLSSIARTLAHADVNIEYAYCTATEHQLQGCLVLKTDAVERTLELLNE